MESLDNLDKLRYSDGDMSTAEIRNTMQDAMQEHAAVYRTSETLSEGKEKIDEVVQWFENVKVTDKSLICNTDMVETLELDTRITQVVQPQ
jgi:succinate dehydrogenase/fumarate reductase flavoprotein subunit